MAKQAKLDPDKIVWVSPEGTREIDSGLNDGAWYEVTYEEVGGYTDNLTGEIYPGKIVPVYGGLVQALDDGDPNTPVEYVAFAGDIKEYKPYVKTDDYADNHRKFVQIGDFDGHQREPKYDGDAIPVDAKGRLLDAEFGKPCHRNSDDQLVDCESRPVDNYGQLLSQD